MLLRTKADSRKRFHGDGLVFLFAGINYGQNTALFLLKARIELPNVEGRSTTSVPT